MRALKAIPVSFRMEWQNTSEVEKYKNITLEQVLNWEKLNISDRKPDKIYGERVIVPLFDLVDYENQNHVRLVFGRDDFVGKTFYVSTWTKIKIYELKVPMEFSIIDNKFTGVEWKGKI
jgi:hypothetical protein